ncbi:uncharacterized protein LOC109540012 [Dendroctonus ponderosae]|uniref:uncharacterized protein LOC109540012 n=1 Tax=Dendroctonus ponderosae TaxID=77166 RepID=UPI0020350B2A|nr:uncharacterized protein LOC109540012 [Dendroctonus ponderosae]KAH1018114.1 hypothetical protein HUJ05_005930 [Dendroctonus ponderosae]
MTSHAVLLMATVLLLAALVSEYRVEARYLPTRSNGDRIDKLRELLKDLLESEIDKEESETQKWRPDIKYFVKRDVEPRSNEMKSH